MRLLLCRNCQMLSVFSFEPSNGVSSLPCWKLEALRGLWCLRMRRRIKMIRSSSGSPLFLCMFIFTMLRPVVWLWKWGSKYLKEEIRCWESSSATGGLKIIVFFWSVILGKFYNVVLFFKNFIEFFVWNLALRVCRPATAVLELFLSATFCKQRSRPQSTYIHI